MNFAEESNLIRLNSIYINMNKGKIDAKRSVHKEFRSSSPPPISKCRHHISQLQFIEDGRSTWTKRRQQQTILHINKYISTKWIHFIDFHFSFNESVFIYLFVVPFIKKSRDSAVGIATGYGARRPRGHRVRVLKEGIHFYFFMSSRPALGPIQPPIHWVSFPGGKAAEAWSWPLTSN
jgi:hypothetical protein